MSTTVMKWGEPYQSICCVSVEIYFFHYETVTGQNKLGKSHCNNGKHMCSQEYKNRYLRGNYDPFNFLTLTRSVH